MFDLTDLIADVENVQDLIVWDSTEETKLRIVDVRIGTDKNDHDYFMPVFEIADESGYKEFSKFYSIPDKAWMDEKKYASTARQLKKFSQCFELPIDQMFDTSGTVQRENFVGKTGWAVLGRENDSQYGDQNYVKQFVLGA